MKRYIGVHEFVPVLFDEQHFCIASVNFHSLLMGFSSLYACILIEIIDFRFRNAPIEIAKPKIENKDPKSKDLSKSKTTEIETPVFAKSFTEFLGLTTSQCN